MPPSEEPVRYGIVGTGMMGVEHIENIAALDEAVVAALADPDPDSRAAAAARAPDAAVFETHEELLASGRCDAVVVAVPNHLHHDVLLDVLAADVHVLAEKPLCLTVAECRDVVAAASERPDRVHWMGLEYRYKPSIARLAELIAGGEAGAVRMVAIREHRYPFLRKVGDWNRFTRNTGGTLVEKCCHFFDLMTLIAGAGPSRVVASGAQDVNHLDERYGGEVPDILDNAFVIVDYDSGVRAMLDLCMFAESGPWEQEISVVGEKGKVEAFVPISAADGLGRVRVGRRDAGVVFEGDIERHDIGHVGLHSGASFLEHVAFLDAIRRRRPPAVTFEDGMLSVAVAEAAQRSIAEGRVVQMDEVLGA